MNIMNCKSWIPPLKYHEVWAPLPASIMAHSNSALFWITFCSNCTSFVQRYQPCALVKITKFDPPYFLKQCTEFAHCALLCILNI